MMPSSVPYQVPYQNQLQFNLGVPLTTQNLAVQFKHPAPILVERVGGQHGFPGKVSAKQVSSAHQNSMGDSAFNYSTLSEDRMEMMSQLAKRDLRNRKLQMEMRGRSSASESVSPHSSPSRTRLQPNRGCERFARVNTTKPRRPLTAKEAGRNRTFGAVQTPPPRKPASHSRLGDDSVMSARSGRNTSMNISEDNDVYFPAKPVMPEGSPVPKDELAKLQQEMEGYLLLVEHIEQRAISERSTKFLRPPVKGKQKDGYLAEEEDLERARVRVGEQNTRSVRNIYNLRQKVKQLQRDVAHADLSKPTKKSQIIAQLGTVHRGAVKAVQMFVNQLPHQDLRNGLPAHYQELALLLRQLTALGTLTQQGKQPDGATNGLLAVLDRVDNLNAKWCAEVKKLDPVPEEKEKKSAVSKGWVSDTKVDKDIFVMKSKPELNVNAQLSKKPTTHVPGPQPQQRRGRPEKRAVGKENRGAAFSQTVKAQRNAELRAGIASLLQQKERVGSTDKQAPPLNRAVAWEVEMGRPSRPPMQDPKKGYMLPSDLIVKREKAQKAVALSNQAKRFAESTISARQKMSSSRPNSAPASPSKRKEVNFDLDQHSPAPWIPPGRSSRSRSLSSERRSRSRSPFYLRDIDRDEVRHMFPGAQSLRSKRMDEDIPSYGFRSLPTDKKLRSADVSNSFIDEVEHRLLQRLMGKRMEGEQKSARGRGELYRNMNHGNVSVDTTGDFHSETDETLDTTELEVAAGREAASIMDAPTLENIKLRLAEMQREQREIRQRWSTLKFTDVKSRSRNFASSEVHPDRYREPPAIEVTRMSKTERPKHTQGPVNKEWVEEPLIFTKPVAKTTVSYLHTVNPQKHDDLQPENPLTLARPPKRLVTLNQTTVERIAAERDKFESYLRKRSHHPSGKFDPWKLVEEVSDEILSDCLRDVAAELETINEDIANHMYKSEFMVDKNQSDTRLQRQQPESPVAQPIGDGVSSGPFKMVDGEPMGEKLTAGDLEKQPVGTMVSVWGSGDRPMGGGDKSLSQRSHSTPRSPAHLGSGKQSPNLSATEPMLEDVSHLLHHRGDTSEEREVKEDGDVGEDGKTNDGNYEDDHDDEDEESDDDDDEYSEEDFEDVSDEEL